MEDRATARRCGAVLAAGYTALTLLLVTESPGRATSDTRMELAVDPGGYLASTLSLWNPQVSLGELQNQAYGYLFPQGAWFALLDQAGMPLWLAQRFWSALVLVLACEGVRRVARQLDIPPWAAAAAGLAYALVPRHVAELSVRSAEILPGVMLPWALLPVVAAVRGRLRPRDAAVLSAAAYACSGGVNGTATAAPVALLAIVVGWAVLTRRLPWRFAVGWGALIAAVSAWWVVSLLRLGAYSPPFFDYVEDARTTTDASGPSAVLRGAGNWVNYLSVAGEPWWPAGHTVSFDPWVVLGSGLVAVLGVVGLLRLGGPFRAPLLVAAAFGLACQVAAHTGPLDGVLAPWLQGLLDGPLAPLRNVPKADPVLRLPLVIGVGVLAADLRRVLAQRLPERGQRRAVARRTAAGALAGALVAGLATMALPIARADTRTPGWTEIPAYWKEAAEFLAERRDREVPAAERGTGAHATWVIPGAGFGIQDWGWTMEETMQAVARSPWVTRSQVPLTPPATIRLLSTLEGYLETGAGSPYLVTMLARTGIDTVLVRHDLETEAAGTTPSSLVSVALARSPGLERVATFGALDLGPAIEVFEVEGGTAATGYDVRDVADAVTVATSVEDVAAAVGAGLVDPAAPLLVAGTDGAAGIAGAPDVVGDGLQRRERSFGRIHDAESGVMTADEPGRSDRVVANYPAPSGADPVVAVYDGIAGLDASSSRGWADAAGQVRPENAPWAALDGDGSTYWRPAPFQDADEQWLEVDLGETRAIGEVELREAVVPTDLDRGVRWRVVAGDAEEVAEPDPVTGRAVVDLGGVEADRVRFEVAAAPSRQAVVALAEVAVDGVRPDRTLRVPGDVPGDADLVFAARPEGRACVTTLLGPDCDPARPRAAEEAVGIDRTVRLADPGSYRLRALVVARSRPGTAELLRPQRGPSATGSSWFAEDPTVAPRMAYDHDPSTSWVADPRDPEPTLRIDLGRTRTIRRVTIEPPVGLARRPQTAVLTVERRDGDTVVREVALDGYGAIDRLRARRLTIAFTHPGAGEDGTPLGIGELRLGGGRLAVPLDGAEPTGAVCGYGPPLEVDGRIVPTRVEGRVGDVVAGGRLAVRPCGERPRRLDLAAGEHRIRLLSTEQFQPVSLVLESRQERERGKRGDRAEVERSRSLTIRSATDTRVVLDVAPGEDAVISAPHNANAGWTATVDGTTLERVVVDGWAQGWVLPEGADGRVVLSYGPQRGYVVGLVGGLVLLGAVLLWAALLLLARLLAEPADPNRESAGPNAPTRGSDAPTRRGWPTVALVVGAVLVGGLVAGPLAAAGAGAGVLLARWPVVVQALVGVTLAVALAFLVVSLIDEPVMPADAVDLATVAALALALGSTPAARRTADKA